MNNIVAILSILFISLVGYMVIWGFGLLDRKDKLLTVGCSYGLGIGLITMQMYIYTRLTIPWEKLILIVPWLILAVILIFINYKNIRFRTPAIPKLDLIEVIFLLGIIFALSYTIFEALIRPVSAWDAWVTWLLKSKVFFIDGGINPNVFNYIRVNYPLVINLLGTFIYVMIEKVDDTAVLLTSSAFYAYTAILFFAVLNRKYGVRYALIFTFLLVTTQNFIRHGGRFEAGLADLPLGYFTFCSVILLLEYMKKSSGKVFLLLNIFLGITGLIKFEGIPIGMAVIIFALYHIYKNKLYFHIPLILFWIAPIAEWEIYQRIYHFRDTYFGSHILEISIQKTINAFWGTFKELINFKSWNFVWIIYFYSLFIFGIRKSKELFILNAVIFSQLIIYLSMYLFTVGNNPESSVERLLMHIAPLAFFYLAILTYRVFPALRKNI